MDKLIFPQGFLWGSATSAHQVEGNNKNNDWWQWEHSEQRAIELRNKNKNPEDYYSGIACDSYNRYEEDFDLARKLNQNAHRLSIEWSRIEPTRAEFDQAEIEHYRKVLKSLRARGIKTFVTLHHFTNPVWFAELGGWEKRQNISLFFEYARKVIDELGSQIDFLIPINEANVYIGNSYIFGVWPPQKRNLFRAPTILKTMASAHNLVFSYVKKNNPGIMVGTAQAIHDQDPIGTLKLFRRLLRYFDHNNFLNRVARHRDFIGVNYYTRHRYTLSFRLPFLILRLPLKQLTDLGWEIYPQGFYNVLMELAKYKLPIYTTENGLADSQDLYRKVFIEQHLEQMHRAIKAGADVRGYLHWSLLDNFEWSEGFKPRFGLIEIDREHSLARKIRPSALYYSEICKNNYLEVERVDSAEAPL